jgi:ribonuclease BN (tRNA processing enzyme)
VLVSHGHPDHCADLNPLLRARALGDRRAPLLPVHAPADALSAVLALDRPGMLDSAFELHEFAPGSDFARQAGLVAAEAGVGRLVLAHLMPGTVRDAAVRGAAAGYQGPVTVASPGLVHHT